MSFNSAPHLGDAQLTAGLSWKVLAVLVLLSMAVPASSAWAQQTPSQWFSGPAGWRPTGARLAQGSPQPAVAAAPSYDANPYRQFSSQLAADRQFLEQYTGAGAAPVRQSQLLIDPDSGEPVINYDDYVQIQPAGEPAYTVIDAPVIYPDDLMPMAYFAPPLWAEGTYLLWWLEGFSTPPLITTSPAGTAQGVAGVLGEPTTVILAGGGRMAGDVRSGGRVALGYWFDDGETLGIEANYLVLASDADGYSAASAGGGGDPFLGRPFFNVEAGFEGPDAELIAIPGVFSGTVQVHAKSSLEGVEALFRRALARNQLNRVDLLAGWRFNRLHDELVIRDFRTSLNLASGLAVGTTIEEIDSFKTNNWFNGAELGVAARARRYRWTLETVLKLALGGTDAEVFIDGRTTTTVPLPGGGSDVDVDYVGLLTQQTNVGVYRRSEFAVVSELGMMLGFDLTPNLTARFGYTFLYWSRVARPGDQIDTDLNLTQLDPGGLVGSPRPRFNWVFDDVWAQGLNFALEYRL